LALAAVWTGASRRGGSVVDLGIWQCGRPAALAGLADRKGAIAEGFDADLVVWDPEATFTVDAARLRQRHKLTPYDGFTLLGVVKETYVRGRLVYRDGGAGGDVSPPTGELLVPRR
jgi:allantoinase